MKTPYLIALAMTAVIVIWMASGLLRTHEDKASPKGESSDRRILVQTETQTAQLVQLSLRVQGHAKPYREVSIRSDITGRVAEVLVKEGQWVASGTVLVRLDIEDRRIKLDRENALLQSRQKAYSRAQTLLKENFQSKRDLEEAYAALKAAEASVAEMKFEIKKLDIKAPFDGVLDARMVEQGGYVSASADIARFVDNNPLIVVVPVAQQTIQQLTLGAQAEVHFATAETRQGKIIYISSLANESTRTFRVEISVDNTERSIPAGISAEVSIPTQEVMGHFVSPAILGLDASGQMGVKTVDENDSVVFHPVSIIQASTDGVWIKGLPQKARIITVGQGFVEAGIKVDTKSATTTSSSPTEDAGDKGDIAQKASS